MKRAHDVVPYIRREHNTLSHRIDARDGPVMEPAWDQIPPRRCPVLLTSKYKTAAIVGLARNQNGKRKVVDVIRERDGTIGPGSRQCSIPKSQAASFIRARIAKGIVVHADEAASRDKSP